MGNKDKKYRLGGSMLAQCCQQLGNETPDLDDVAYFKTVFQLIQNLIQKDLVLSGHDVSEGGLITALLEMAFAGNCQLEAFILSSTSKQKNLFFLLIKFI